MTLLIHLLGQAQISRDGEPIVIPGHRPLALLAYLLVTGEAYSRQHRVDLLFEGPDAPVLSCAGPCPNFGGRSAPITSWPID